MHCLPRLCTTLSKNSVLESVSNTYLYHTLTLLLAEIRVSDLVGLGGGPGGGLGGSLFDILLGKIVYFGNDSSDENGAVRWLSNSTIISVAGRRYRTRITDPRLSSDS